MAGLPRFGHRVSCSNARRLHPCLPGGGPTVTRSIIETELRSVSPRRTTAPGSVHTIRVTIPAPRDQWREIVGADPSAGPSHLPEWLDCACDAEGWTDASRLYDLSNGRRIVVPMVRRSPVPGVSSRFDTYASMPRGWSVGGILAAGGATSADLSAVLPDLAVIPGIRVLVRPDFSTARLWSETWSRSRSRIPQRCDVVVPATYILDLTGGFETVWTQRFSSKARSGIRNAQRKSEAAGLVIRSGNSPRLVSDFYKVYLRWLARRAVERQTPRLLAEWMGRRREPLRRFETVARVFGDRSRIWVAYLGDVPVATAYAVYHGTVGMGWRAFSDRELTGSLRTHEQLQVHAIEYACRIGCLSFDMGQAGGIAGLEHVKGRFGGTAHNVPEFTWETLPFSKFGRAFVELRRELERGSLALHNRRTGQRS
ncbi:GNAT family N-acetyltransferase [Rhodococcus sp. BUPNP1]|uniref:GNAT family N-acetyltransferase n=1 Tax=Rhodococcus sp. BUPNP1 TaxID=1432786 RepID=UPI000B5A97C4|nr:hypothetical protein B9C99_20145 [Rhodococcus sp. BUPNP1]